MLIFDYICPHVLPLSYSSLKFLLPFHQLFEMFSGRMKRKQNGEKRRTRNLCIHIFGLTLREGNYSSNLNKLKMQQKLDLTVQSSGMYCQKPPLNCSAGTTIKDAASFSGIISKFKLHAVSFLQGIGTDSLKLERRRPHGKLRQEMRGKCPKHYFQLFQSVTVYVDQLTPLAFQFNEQEFISFFLNQFELFF